MSWEITHRGQTGLNGTWKVIARRGSQVVIIDRLTEAEANAFDAQTHWDNGRVRPEANKCSVSVSM